MSAVCFYISGHGFGHASRQIEIINALGAASPTTHLLIRTSAPRWLFERTLRVPSQLLPGECDTGVVQMDSLQLDATETITARLRRFTRRSGDTGERRRRDCCASTTSRSSSWMRRRLAVPLPRAGVDPVGRCLELHVGLDLRGTMRRKYRRAPQLSRRCAAYASRPAAWRLPMHGGFETFDGASSTCRSSPGTRVTRRAEVATPLRAPARTSRSRCCPSAATASTTSTSARLDCLDRWRHRPHARRSPGQPRYQRACIDVAEDDALRAGLRYEDLVAAVDVVITKPGYGIISECVANGTAMLYTSRGHFVEYDVMVSEMPRYLRCRHLEQADLFSGRWGEGLDAVYRAPAPPRTAVHERSRSHRPDDCGTAGVALQSYQPAMRSAESLIADRAPRTADCASALRTRPSAPSP